MCPTLLETSIEIDATAARVWSVLTDFEAYPQWNPFVLQITGKLESGSRLSATIRPEGGRAMTFAPTVSMVAENREFRWKGELYRRGVMDAEHRFCIEPLGADHDGVRFIHSESFGGILSPLILAVIRKKTLAGFNAMNRALKSQAEGDTRHINLSRT